jgi:hypothetical protein
MSADVRLTPRDVALAELTAELTAQRLVELLRAERAVELDGASPFVDAAELAHTLGVSREYVYRHADELGAVRLGEGEKPRLRFDLDAARAAREVIAANGSTPNGTPTPARPHKRRSPAGSVLVSRPRIPTGRRTP